MDPVLGITERVKLQRAKEERIASLETENAILHLQIAQLRGSLLRLLTGKSERCRTCDIYREKVSSLEQQVKVLYSELGGLHEQFSVFQEQLQSKMKTLQTIVPAVMRRDPHRETEMNELHAKYLKEKQRRKELHNALVELRGNIRVHCRVRPVLGFNKDHQHKAVECVQQVDEETVTVQQVRSSVSGPVLSEKHYEFDRVYGPRDSQESVFSDVQPLITSLLDGYNVCVMAYGQTGSGKTYTMLGEGGGLTPGEQQGLIPQATQELFSLMKEREKNEDTSFSVSVTVAEIYNEQIRDLLATETGMGTVKHDIMSTSSGTMEVTNLTTRPVTSSQEVVSLVYQGMQHRAADSTLIHEHSSRSHLIVTISIECRGAGLSDAFSTSSLVTPTHSRDSTTMASPANSTLRPRSTLPSSRSQLPTYSGSAPNSVVPGSKKSNFCTKLQLVDLAGSECVGVSGVSGSALREAQYINKSLSSLSDVLGALAEKRGHIPYRNSILTYLLQDSIGGNAKFVLLVCVSPTVQYLAESTRVMGFGSRARQVQRGPTKSQKSNLK